MLYNNQYCASQVKLFMSCKYFQFVPLLVGATKRSFWTQHLILWSQVLPQKYLSILLSGFFFYPFEILVTHLNSVLWHHTLPSGHAILAVPEQRYISGVLGGEQDELIKQCRRICSMAVCTHWLCALRSARHHHHPKKQKQKKNMWMCHQCCKYHHDTNALS